jgi:16S rRNA (guanine(966)-N(2))-methyltransferase RsmD
MRVIAGKWKGRVLAAPPGRTTRPVLDRVREAIFDALGSRLAEPGHLPPCEVLDLFAGSGSLGIEALSRGARSCRFVENDWAALQVLRRNLDHLQAGPEAEIIAADAEGARLAGGYQLVFMDPPYDLARDNSQQGAIGRLLSRLSDPGILLPDACVVLRHPSEVRYDQERYGRLSAERVRRYGDMTVTFLAIVEP